jgi:hypothetical protein
MSLLTPVVFPLFPIVDGACGCGKEGCKRVGKHPAVDWGDITHDNQAALSHRPAHGAGYGIKTGALPHGSDIIVVDCDSVEALERWQTLCGGTKPVTYEVVTGRGWQWYFEHPGFYVGNNAGELAPGLDIRGDGGFVVGAGSPHRNGKTYEAVERPIAPAPAWLVDWLRARSSPPTKVQPSAGRVTDPEELAYRRALFVERCKRASPLETGKRYHGLFPVVQYAAHDLGLSDEDIVEAISEHWNPRFPEPLTYEALVSHVLGHAEGARTKSTRPAVDPMPRDVAFLAGAGFVVADTAARHVPMPNIPGPEVSGADILPARWGGWDAPVAPPVYILDGLVPENKVVTLFAEGGSLKTWAALSLAIAVARGEPWLGCHAVQQGPALYLDWEDGPYEFSRRVRLLTGGTDVPALGYLYGGEQIDSAEFWRVLGETVTARKIRLVVIDSLNASMPGNADENVTAFAAGVKMAGRCTEIGCTVAIVHHANKTGGIRGTSAIRDASDVVFQFEPVSETDDVKRMRMVCDKPGPQKRPKPVNIELSDDGVRTFVDEANDAGRNAEGAGDVRSAVLLALAVKPYTSTQDLSRAVGKRKQDVLDTLKSLVSAGEVVDIPIGTRFTAGYQLDDNAKRCGRVLSCVQGSRYSSFDLLRRDAFTPRAFVDRMVSEGALIRSGDKSILPIGQFPTVPGTGTAGTDGNQGTEGGQ